MNNLASTYNPALTSESLKLWIQSDSPTAQAAAQPLMEARNLFKSYQKGKLTIPVLKGVDFAVQPGEFVSIVGSSGSGKSTLLHLLAALDLPDAGEIMFEENRVDRLKSTARDILRNRHFGMIFQFYHLLPELTVLENVLAPAMIRHGAISYWMKRRTLRKLAEELLNLVGLSHRLGHRPRELSGGEMQRTAIARALIAQPRILLADEPTGNLDQASGREILELLRGLNQQQKLTIVMVTHDNAIARQTDRIVRIVEGRIEAL